MTLEPDLIFTPDVDLSARAVESGPTPGLDPAPVGQTVAVQAVAAVVGSEAGAAFDAQVRESGWDTAIARLESGQFGEPRPGAPLSFPALLDGVRAGRDLDGSSGDLTLARNDGALAWVLGVLQGDFNENPSLSQTIVGAVLTAVPGLDQLADARDVVANALKIREDPRSLDGWVGAALTGIGLIPTAGSLAKGALKTILRTDNVADLARGFRALGIDDPGRFLLDHTRNLGSSARSTFNAALDAVAEALEGIAGLHPSLAVAAGDLRAVQAQGTGLFMQATRSVEERISYVANRIPKLGNPENVGRALTDAGFTRARQFTFGASEVVLNRDGLNHILKDHHPRFWQNDPNRNPTLQTFFGRDQSVSEIVGIAESVLQQNREAISTMHGRGQVRAVVDGVRVRPRLARDPGRGAEPIPSRSALSRGPDALGTSIDPRRWGSVASSSPP